MKQVILALALISLITGIVYGLVSYGQKVERTQCNLESETIRADAAQEARETEQLQQKGVNDAIKKQYDNQISINKRLNADLNSLRNRPERKADLPKAARVACEGANGLELAGNYARVLTGRSALAAEQDAALESCQAAYDAISH